MRHGFQAFVSTIAKDRDLLGVRAKSIVFDVVVDVLLIYILSVCMLCVLFEIL